MTIDYQLHPERQTSPSHASISEATSTDLRYDYFPGDIILTDSEANLSARWGWIQILDFAIALRMIAHDLSEGSSKVFDFTESDETLTFSLENGTVRIKASYVADVISTDQEHFKQKVTEFYGKVVGDLLAKNPQLKQNSFFKTLLDNGHSTE